MADYKALRYVAAYPFDKDLPPYKPGEVISADERDPGTKAYIEAVMESPGAVEKVSAQSKVAEPEVKPSSKPKKDKEGA